ncbi:hypothetical protein HDV05_008412 [Chytridiales sp. JEL 0842]|nr:hypothetical protein HDV05_008412 [Chytridiales sp. JEL 0842]
MQNAVSLGPNIEDDLKAFRFRKDPTTAALIFKIDVGSLTLVKDQLLDNATFDDIQEEVPDSSPRYLVISYKFNHPDGRVSYPLIGINYMPSSTSDKNRMLYSSTKTLFFQKADVHKVFDLNDIDELKEDWLNDMLSKKK